VCRKANRKARTGRKGTLQSCSGLTQDDYSSYLCRDCVVGVARMQGRVQGGSGGEGKMYMCSEVSSWTQPRNTNLHIKERVYWEQAYVTLVRRARR
jgi:hypothetical protein